MNEPSSAQLTLDGGRVTADLARQEIALLERRWGSLPGGKTSASALRKWLPAATIAELDHFDHIQLGEVITVCQASTTLADAGRTLFNVSRLRKRSSNDSHRLKQYLQKFGLTFEALKDKT